MTVIARSQIRQRTHVLHAGSPKVKCSSKREAAPGAASSCAAENDSTPARASCVGSENLRRPTTV